MFGGHPIPSPAHSPHSPTHSTASSINANISATSSSSQPATNAVNPMSVTAASAAAGGGGNVQPNPLLPMLGDDAEHQSESVPPLLLLSFSPLVARKLSMTLVHYLDDPSTEYYSLL